MAQTEFGQLKRDDSGYPVGWAYLNITDVSTTRVVKNSPGMLHAITINNPKTGTVITIYDNTAASGTKIGTITLPATLLGDGPSVALYDVACLTGLTITTGSGASDFTVSYI